MGDLGVKHRQLEKKATVLLMILFLFKNKKVQLTGAFNQGDVPHSDVQHRGGLKIFFFFLVTLVLQQQNLPHWWQEKWMQN